MNIDTQSILLDNILCLKHCKLFGSIPLEVIRNIAEHSVRREFVEGDLIFKCGTEAAGVYIIMEGNVEIALFDQHNNRVIYKTYGPDGLFGLQSTISGKASTNEVKALGYVETLLIPAKDFRYLLGFYEQVVHGSIIELSVKIKELKDYIIKED